MEKDLAGYVFHDISWEPAVLKPEQRPDQPEQEYYKELKHFMKHDQVAFGVVLKRIDKPLRPQLGADWTSKDLYDTIATAYRPVTTVDVYDTLKVIGTIKLSGTHPNTLKYCQDFNNWYQKHTTAYEQYSRSAKLDSDDQTRLHSQMLISETLAKFLFVQGLSHIEWLRSWRHYNLPERTTLEQMITNLRKEKVPSNL